MGLIGSRNERHLQLPVSPFFDVAIVMIEKQGGMAGIETPGD
jgi:hypothetical protein